MCTITFERTGQVLCLVVGQVGRVRQPAGDLLVFVELGQVLRRRNHRHFNALCPRWSCPP